MDEFPQLFNIIKGEMVFFGPRPALHNQFDLIEMRENYGINNLTPGLTGWAQVNGRDLISLKQKVELDSYYLKNKSISLNVKIFFKTLKNLLLIKGVSH
jgi:O-antigen biosynthesis protein WbqP